MPIRIKLRIDDPQFREHWLSNRDSLRGTHQVPVHELFTQEFMLRESRLKNFDDFVAEAKVRDDVRSVDDMTDKERIAWDLFIRTQSRFTGWPELLGNASSEWLARKIRGEESPNAATSTALNSDSIDSSPTASEKKAQGPGDDFPSKIMAKLQASNPLAFQFALWIRLKIEKRQPQSGWSQWLEDPPRYEASVDATDQQGRTFYYDITRSLFQEVESLIYHLRRDPAFLEWKKQQPPPPPSIYPTPGTPEAVVADREARIAFMLKAGATEEEISAFQWGILGNDLLGPGGAVWSAMDSISPTAKTTSFRQASRFRPTNITSAYSVNARATLNSKLRALETAQQNAARIRQLPDGRIRYYEAERLATRPGPTRGNAYVTEWDPDTGRVRSWAESYDHAGKVTRVHPKMVNGQQVTDLHYPPTGSEVGQ